MITKKVPLHPLFFGLFYVLSIYQTNMEHHALKVIWIPLLATLIGGAVFWTTSTLFSRKVRYSAFITSLFIITLLCLPFIQDTTLKYIKHDLTFPLSVILTAVFSFGIKKVGRDKIDSPKLMEVLNIISICTLITPLFSIAGSTMGKFDQHSPIKGEVYIEDWEIHAELSPQKIKDAPDIYHIVLDGYGRNDVLNRLFKYDNSPFTDSLKAKGFYVAEKAAANYCQTGLSMASALNTHYLKLPKDYENTNNRQILRGAFYGASIPARLIDAGYKLRITDNDYYLTEKLHGAKQISFDDSLWSEFSFEVIKRTLSFLPKLYKQEIMINLGNKTLYKLHMNRTHGAFDFIETDKALNIPSYTLIHIVSPHPPFMLADQTLRETPALPYSMNDGSHLIQSLKGGPEEYRRLYVSQLKYINEKLENAITQLQKNHTGRDLVIIVQGDHGPGSALDWNDVLKSDAQERLAIITALYFSDGDYSNLYEHITPINFWRVILNKYLLEDELELLEDRSFISSWPRPYQFHEIDTDTGSIIEPQPEV